MTSLPSFTVTPVLREAAELRVEELEREKQEFLRRYHLDNRRSAETDIVKRVTSLLEDIKTHDGDLEEDDDLQIMSRYVQQAKDDKTIESKLLKFEEKLWAKLNRYLRRLEVSSLHVSLLMEAFNEELIAESMSAELDKVSLDEDFEVVESHIDELLERFGRDTFTAMDVDEDKLESYLTELINGQSAGLLNFKSFKNRMEELGEKLLDDGLEVDQETLIWVIVEFLKVDTISAEKKKDLEKYLHAPIALRELATTINMKTYANWKYKGSGKGLPVNAHQESDGRYSIVVEEELVDMIFLHCTATRLGMELKEQLNEFISKSFVFYNRAYTHIDREKRRYYLDPAPPIVKEPAPHCSLCNPEPPPPPPNAMFMPPPPPCVAYPIYSGRKKAKKDKKKSYMDFQCALPPPPPPHTGVSEERRKRYIEHFCMSRLPESVGSTANIVSQKETAAQLIKILAADAKVIKMTADEDGSEEQQGSIHVFSSQLNLSNMPHNAIIRVLKFLGLPKKILDFFTRFLKANLNTGPTVRGTPDRILSRARGIPAGHCLETVISEVIICFLGMAVFKKTNCFLYHVGNEVYFLGDNKQKRQAMEQVTQLCEVIGLDESARPISNSLDIGCLTLNTSKGIFEISDQAVTEYAQRVKQKLDTYTSVLNWICIWNNSCGTYAEHLFGPLADVFGKSHLEAVKTAYNQIFSIVFPDTDLTTHIKRLLLPHANTTTSPLPLEAIIYLPQAYGGLGVKNPFIALNLAHNMKENKAIDLIFQEYFKNEEAYYQKAKTFFLLHTAEQRQHKLNDIFGTTELLSHAFGPLKDTASFISKKDLTAHRESTEYRELFQLLPSPPLDSASVPPPGMMHMMPLPGMPPMPTVVHVPRLPPPPPGIRTHPDLRDVYTDLLFEPNEDVLISDRIRDEILELRHTGDMKSLYRLSSEEKWVLQMYGDECFEWFGTLQVWWPQGVPTEVYKAVRGHLWCDGDDDGESVSSYGSSRV